MKTRISPPRLFTKVGLTMLLTLSTVALAQALPKEGSFDITNCYSGTANRITFSKANFASTFEHSGTVLSNPPGGMFDKSTFHCVGMDSTFDGKSSGRSVCEATDPDGDKRLTDFSYGSDGKVTRMTVEGTGKYEGLVESSSYTRLGPFPVIKTGIYQNCNHQTGTYKLK